jgi:hypothetical protein
VFLLFSFAAFGHFPIFWVDLFIPVQIEANFFHNVFRIFIFAQPPSLWVTLFKHVLLFQGIQLTTASTSFGRPVALGVDS